MAATAAQVKELREKTGAGMMDCKNALNETNGDMAKAIDWLREKGIAKSLKKANRIAAEGLSKVVVDGNKACLVEINSETDFVAKNEQFLALLDKVTNTILASNAKTNDEALALSCDGKTLNDLFIEATATIGEKIVLRRFAIVEKTDDQKFGSYIHMGGKISALAICEGADDAQAKDMAMQIASMAPSYVSSADLPKEIVDHERQIQEEIAKNDESLKSKPENVLQGIIQGRISKSLKDMCLVDQEYFKDTSKKVSQVLKETGITVKSFVRYLVGEGLEKREENFADEVAKQMA